MNEHKKYHSSQTLPPEMSSEFSKSTVLINSSIINTVKPTISIRDIYSLIIPVSTCPSGIVYLKSFKYGSSKQRSI